MLTIYAVNVRDALPQGIRLLKEVGELEQSRNGTVLVAPCPVMTVYERPTERVLFSAERDANPFFHLAEALWMLAGRRDAEFLNQFIKDFGERFAQPDGRLHGAYGYRWRVHFIKDQLEEIIMMLLRDPTTRHAVLTMWDPVVDLGVLSHLKDRPCNTQAYFRINKNALDMTVLCRSNDIIWGLYGANAVHFSVLQEYMAAQLELPVGVYYHLSNNFHAYQTELEKRSGTMEDAREISTQPLVDAPAYFDEELAALLQGAEPDFHNLFLSDTAFPMFDAYRAWRKKEFVRARLILSEVRADDWRTACQEWLWRRTKHVVAA